MKALLSSLAVAVVATTSLAFFSADSSFRAVDPAQASAITGGACYKVIAAGCHKVIGVTRDGAVIIGKRKGCGTVRGTKAVAEEGKFRLGGTAKWCSDSQSWTCGAVITKRPRCVVGV